MKKQLRECSPVDRAVFSPAFTGSMKRPAPPTLDAQWNSTRCPIVDGGLLLLARAPTMQNAHVSQAVCSVLSGSSMNQSRVE